MRHLIRLTLLLLCLSVPFAALAQSSEQPSGTITVGDSAAQDAAIANRIRDILAELEGYDDVTVSTSSGIVTLRGSTLDTVSANRLNDLVSRVEGVVAIENEVIQTVDVGQRLDPAFDRFLERGTRLLSFAPLAFVAVSVFVLVILLGFTIARLKYPWDRLAPNAFIAELYRQIVRIAFGIGGLVIALDVLNATALLSGILGAAGIVGLAIGFAVRGTV